MKIWQIKTIVATVAAVVLFVLLMIIILWEQGIIKPTTDKEDLSQFLDLTEDEFLELFHLPQVDDPEEKMKRVRALREHQQAVLENNKLYQAMRRTWFEGINEFSDIPDEEFIATHTGLIEDPDQFNSETQPVLEESVMSNLPASYDSVSLGHVSPVKNQGGCGSSVAFATMALVETCFEKTVGMFGDYSEQHLLDCAGARGVVGCHGSWASGYTSWLTANKPKLASEKNYPYTAREGTCRTDYEEFHQGVKISGSYRGRGNEETLKALVYQHGAVLVTVAVNANFTRYRGGIFGGCYESDKVNQAVVVVGYGSENGLDYWLVKNSWGPGWGDQGYIKIMRGVNMCGIGTTMVTLSCEAGEEENNPGIVRPWLAMLCIISIG